MGVLRNINVDPISLAVAPGFRFRPSKEQIFDYYLAKKNDKHCNSLNFTVPSASNSNLVPFDFSGIAEIDLRKYNPCDFKGIACFPFGCGGKKKHWYFFVAKSLIGGRKRKARGGFWKSKGLARNVLAGKGGEVLGTKRTFLFFRGSSSCPKKTDWVLYEYALADHNDQKDSFVLCRVLHKSCGGNKTSNRVAISYAEESLAAMHNVGINVPDKQHDRASISGVGEPENDALAGFTYGIINGGTVIGNTLADELIINSTRDGDFLELDDLVHPLPGNFLSG